MAIPTSFTYENNSILISNDISKNNITIDGIDYFAYYINPYFKNLLLGEGRPFLKQNKKQIFNFKMIVKQAIEYKTYIKGRI